MSPDSTRSISYSDSEKNINLTIYYYAPIRKQKKKEERENVASKLNKSFLK